MSESLNEMFENNRAVIGDIAEHSGRIKGSSERLNQAAVQLSDQFKKIENYMTDVNEAMMSASAATEEVNASVEEVNSSVSVLASEAEKSNMQADQIRFVQWKLNRTVKKPMNMRVLSAVRENRKWSRLTGMQRL